MKNFFLFILPVLFFTTLSFAQTSFPHSSQNYEKIMANYNQLTLQQLLDTGNFYFRSYNYETAMPYYTLIICTPVKNNDTVQQQIISKAYVNTSVCYISLCDYYSAYEALIKLLTFCEQTSNIYFKIIAYNNIGKIYNEFKMFDIAKEYFVKALSLCEDSTRMVLYLNNLGDNAMKREKTDSAFYYLNQALKISKRHNNAYLDAIFSSIAETYQKEKQYDSAIFYYRLSLDGTIKKNQLDQAAGRLFYISGLFFEFNKIDSALCYIDHSIAIASEMKFLGTLADNYLLLSKIEEARGHTTQAFEYFKTYANLKDSIFSVSKFSDINQLQRLYEVSKTNQQIESLVIEQQVKERTIHYQKMIMFIILGVLFLAVIGLLFIYLQNRKLNRSYKILVEKNVEIMELHNNSLKINKKKYEQSALNDDTQRELINKILLLFDNPAIICDADFTVDKLAELVHSNQFYVSQAINDGLNKNFRSLLNGYRIREAQRLFSDPKIAKYTIESVAHLVGFKSRNTFQEAFKEITGVNPNFYLQSMREKG